MSTASHPNDVVAFNLKTPTQVNWLTDVHGDVLMGKEIGDSEEGRVAWEAGIEIKGWIVKPVDLAPSHK